MLKWFSLKKSLLIMGISAGAFVVSVFLHNAIYGLFIHWFGVDFWGRIGVGDEPVFFIIATIVCPLGFLVGAVGSIVLAIKKFRMARKSLPGSPIDPNSVSRRTLHRRHPGGPPALYPG